MISAINIHVKVYTQLLAKKHNLITLGVSIHGYGKFKMKGLQNYECLNMM